MNQSDKLLARVATMENRKIMLEHLPEVVSQYRQKMGATQKQVAQIWKGATPSLISDLEKGRCRNWALAEAVLHLAGWDFYAHGCRPTPWMREAVDRYVETGKPVNVEKPDGATW